MLLYTGHSPQGHSRRYSPSPVLSAGQVSALRFWYYKTEMVDWALKTNYLPCPWITTFKQKGEPKQIWTWVCLLTNRPPCQWAKPAHTQCLMACCVLLLTVNYILSNYVYINCWFIYVFIYLLISLCVLIYVNSSKVLSSVTTNIWIQ